MSTSPHPTSILLLGSGELGTAILHSLTAHPSYNPAVTTKLSILRRPESLASGTQSSLPTPLGRGGRTVTITYEAADLAHDPIPTLAALFRTYDVVIHAGGFTAPRGTLLRVAEAAVQAGVKRFFPWQFGADYEAIAAAGGGGGVEHSGHRELFGEMLAVRELLRRQEWTKWTIVSTGLFMSFLFLRGFGVVDLEGRKVRALGGWDTRVTVTEVEGIGRMVAEMVFNPGEEMAGRSGVVYVAGDTVSYRDVADIVEEVYGGGFEREVLDMERLKKRIEEEPGDVMPKYQHVFGAGVGVSWEKEKTANYQRGIKLMSLREYVEQNKEALAEANK
ncbi:hypothetical protein VTJ49DRAFT_6156 [Mycothermus thermophilus]|uniref:NmrA-like domain-containing protein n=1 Tax=Humicola insolens TaxID=85995 RepID=A0ABR3V1Y2_HUMIN